jgi:hypothetical protein
VLKPSSVEGDEDGFNFEGDCPSKDEGGRMKPNPFPLCGHPVWREASEFELDFDFEFDP